MELNKNIGLKLRMTFVMAVIGFIIISFGAFIGYYFQNMAFTVVFVVLFSFAQYWMSHTLTLKAMGAKEVSENEYPDLHAKVTRLSQQADIPKPTVAIMDTKMPNAFATGRSQKTAVVCVTTELIELLEDDELDAVIAHELAHIKNRDMIVMTIAGIAAVLAGFILRWGFIFQNQRSNGPAGVLILVAILTYILSFLFMRMLSRFREYYADRGAVSITGNPTAMANALRRINGDFDDKPKKDLRDVENMSAFMIHPITGGRMTALLSTHPSTENRINKIQEMEKELK